MRSTIRNWSKLSSLVSCRSLSNHFGAISSAAAPQAWRPSGNSIRARTKACGASRSVTTPKRNGRRKWTGRSNSSIARTWKRGVSTMGVQAFEQAAQVADGAGGAARAVRHVIERLDGDEVAVVAQRLHRAQRAQDGFEAHRALARPAAVGIVDLHVADVAAGHPALHQRGHRLLLGLPGGAAVDHGLEGGRGDLANHAYAVLDGVEQVGLARGQGLDAVGDPAGFGPPGRARETVPRAVPRLLAGGARRHGALLRRAVHEVAAAHQRTEF